MKKIMYFFAAFVFTCSQAFANNIQISNVTTSGNNITFDISWENSWNSMNNIDLNYPNNWDAAWVFIKVQSSTNNLWLHQLVSTNAANHSISGGVLQIDAVTDGVGVFIRRSSPGYGNVSATATLAMQTLPSGTLNFKAFGIEMVRTNTGNFGVNDSTTGFNRFLSYNVSNATIPASALFVGSPTLANTYPTGYAAFYAAKYESTNEQVVDYLNCLTYDQQANLTDVAPNSVVGTKAYNPGGYAASNYIKILTPGVNNTSPAVYGCDFNANLIFNDPTDGQNTACAMFTVRRAISFLDWSGLRPMTEMEYEKLCRGTKFNGQANPRVIGEYPWGTTEFYNYNAANLSFTGTDTERVDAPVINGRCISYSLNAGYYPARVGQFAQNATGRASSGAGFYGNMDLAGNVWEIVVGVNTTSNPITITSLGDGNVNPAAGPTNGDGNQPNWSNYAAPTYWGLKGGSWWETTYYNVYTQVSDRQTVPLSPSSLITTSIHTGVRGVR
ncbi:MAG: hypothetical protein IPI22_10125 [Bacteroidetes bacterium]|jgi:formylglycine-generating enzyme required for sulfatase activity|nr:hypothetical protein [Bacteroidota bacterium]MBK7041274.1 hypothetical protein [Bacteroidota bacterium]MBK7588656.1 hypothetical protein [Bacteroidota bacterium]MBK9481533.1 hypothetical protein [Bacteroidota bacterium]HQW46104.1 hypothetical protein [Chitinophagaceae bacterium]